MNRHHPYGAGYDAPPRRGGSPASAGPDRSHRYNDRGGGAPFRGRGYNNRGRGGGYSSYDGANMSNAHDQSNQSQPYGDYEVQPPAPSAYFAPPGGNYGEPTHYSTGYEGYDKYEDAPAQGYDTDPSRRPRQPRKERDDKLHDSIIEERIQRERPCRTLFIRNIKYETSSDDVRALFEEHGEIKTFFDLISTRGMVFVTYYDLRAAERARERLQGSEISNRPIDVHYSLPRDDQRGGEREKNQQFQGTLQVTLRNSPSGSGIDDNELRRKFQQFGDVKSVRPVADRIDSRYVEFYDTRACDEAFDRLRHQSLQDGVMDIVFAWDNSEGANSYNGASQAGGREGAGHHRNWEEPRDRGHRGGRGRGGRGRGRGRNNDSDFDRQGNDDFGRSRRFDDDYGRGGRGGGAGGGGGGYNDRYADTRGNYNGAPAGYPPAAAPGPPPIHYGVPQPPPNAVPQGPPLDDRLDQARKVQQLLAALKQPQNGQSGTVTPPSAMPPMAPAPPNPNSYYSQPMQSMPPYPGTMPPLGTYTGGPPPSSAGPTSPPPGAALAGLPPNIMALLQQAQQRPPGGPPASPYGMAPPNAPPYQQLVSYLAQTQGPK